MAVALGIMFYTNWKLSLVSLSVLPFLWIAAYFFKEGIKKSFQDVRTQVGRLNAFLQEHITGMQIVQVFNREDEEMEKFKKINELHRDANIRSIFAYSIFFPVIEVLSAVSIALMVWYAAGAIVTSTMTFGVLVGFILYLNLLFRPIRQIADKFNTLQMGIVSGDRVFQVLDEEDAIPDLGTLVPELKGKVEFKNVNFGYNDDSLVLKDISFTIDEGKTLAIVGHTGAGKSSIINLINRLYAYQNGQILIDDLKIEDLKLEWLRKNIAVVLQDVFLFSDTILNNIRLFNDKISKNEIMHAAQLVGAHDFIERLPGGYDYQVQERGATLSTGQRQLISFIRAIIQNPKILILDEATSSIDQETEEMIQHATEVLLKGRTSIVIAHRLSTIQNASQIIVMDKGQIKERGTHDQLLAHGGLYRQLYELQFTELVL
jgi:ATP-binding cassette subfamily B protein